MSWTEERVAELSRLWESGFSASMIGKKLGVTKNAVVGKAHRMKLQSRPSPIKRDQSRPPVRKRAAVAIAKQPVEQLPQLTTPPPVVTAIRMPVRAKSDGKGPRCLWPIGDPGDPDFHFCDDIAVAGKSYCDVHCERAYITRSRSESRSNSRAA